jgi:hypothetical protein
MKRRRILENSQQRLLEIPQSRGGIEDETNVFSMISTFDLRKSLQVQLFFMAVQYISATMGV